MADPNKVIGPKKRGQKKGLEKEVDDKFLNDLDIQAKQQPSKRKFKFSQRMCDDLEYYIQKYSDDYQAMARDKKNIYQDSPGQLRSKILKHLKLKKGNETSSAKSKRTPPTKKVNK